jgi:hypothetical protein
MSRIALESIPGLTFYKNALTAARRTSPIAQLVCLGKACGLYQPDVVRCTNIGGSGTDVDWKCEADLPSSLRFGRVEVSCEGWNGPGDPYVMKGSCSLEYNLVQLPDALNADSDSSWSHFYTRPWFSNLDYSGIFFMFVWIVVLGMIIYSFIQPCLRRNASDANYASPPSYPGDRQGRSGPGGFPGSYYTSPPPPYTKDAGSGSGSQWQPGFWTGAALGALGNHILNRPSGSREYDWERERRLPGSISRSRLVPGYDSQDRGEGSSNLGAMRTSTGYGGSSSR